MIIKEMEEFSNITKNLEPKGVLWTEGTEHLVIGLTIDPDGVLWGFDMHNHVVLGCLQMDKMPNHDFGDRAFSNATFDKEGNIYLGECLVGNTPYPGSFYEAFTRSRSRRLCKYS